MELKKYKLGDVVDFFNGKQRPTSTGEFPLFGGNGIIDYVGEFNYEDVIIIGRVGANCGCIQICDQKCWVSDNAISVHVKKGFDKYYIYFLLNSLDLNSKHVGAAQPLITQSILSELPISIPSLSIQRQIASVLSTLDEKIALNRAINQNLEALAKQIYDYWFVQFDFPDENGNPYKSYGGKMVYNETLKREIPEGWEVKSINDLCESNRGVTYEKNDLISSDKGVLILRGNNIEGSHLVYDSNVVYVPKSFVSDEQKIRKNDIIMTMSSGSKEHIGKCIMFQEDSSHSYGAFLTKFTPNNYPHLIFVFFLSDFFKAKIKRICSGTGINNLTNQTFDEILIPLPDSKICQQFEDILLPIFTKIGLNESQCFKLGNLRDHLLPLLMNGQVTIKEDNKI